MIAGADARLYGWRKAGTQSFREGCEAPSCCGLALISVLSDQPRSVRDCWLAHNKACSAGRPISAGQQHPARLMPSTGFEARPMMQHFH